MATVEEIRAAAQAATAPTADLLAQIAQLQALNQSPQQQLTPAPAAPPELKCYFSSVPFCNIHVNRGPSVVETLCFVAGRLETSDAGVQAHLDSICDKPGSTVTSAPAGASPEEVAVMQADLKERAEKAHGRMVASGLSTS